MTIDSIKLADLYNGSDIEAIDYMLPFCKGEMKKICKRIRELNVETNIGWGKRPATSKQIDEYYDSKWNLLNHFKVYKDDEDEANGFDRYLLVLGFNTKQYWLYDEYEDAYIDPPIEVLDKLDRWDSEKSEDIMLEILKDDPEWLYEEEWWIREDVDI